MWQPDPAWAPVGAPGRSGAGVWLAEQHGRTWAVKRLIAPVPGDPDALADPTHAAYWRREADVALEQTVRHTPGVRGAEVLRVDEDDLGATVWTAAVDQTESNGLFRAHALGVLATATIEERPWFAGGVLRERLDSVGRHGGWRTLARTTVADLADLLWFRRTSTLERLDALPRVVSHHDPTPANLRGRDGDRVVAVDWGSLGLGPVGGDLGYLALSEREDFDVLIEAYAAGLGDGGTRADLADVAYAARATAVYTAFNRAEWTLARVAAGPGALVGKYRHPSVAPTLRQLQRLLPQADALL